MISEGVIHEVIERTNIVEVVSEHVQLKKRGTNYIGICPFHSEKTPSFTVNEAKNLFYCFGCHTGGNAATFLVKHLGLSFPDAVKTLAKRCGIKVAEDVKGKRDVGEDVFNLNKMAMEFFAEALCGAEGITTRRYLKERGYDDSTIDAFRLGYAPHGSGNRLADYIKKKGVDVELALTAGLVGKKDGRYYDKFRGRLMFPITDSGGRVIAFGGRSMDGSEPKYLNSPETPLFKKSSTLYGIYKARKEISKTGSVILVEGYFDLIALHKNGFINSVATLGTAISAEHIRRLKPYAKSIYLLFDRDDAGKGAIIKSLNMFLGEDVRAMVIELPDSNDPDEFLRKHTPGEMKGLLEGAKPLMEYFLIELKNKYQVSAPDGKADYLDEVVPYLMKIQNVAEKGHYAAMTAEVVGVPPGAVYSAIKMEEKGNALYSAINRGSGNIGRRVMGALGKEGGRTIEATLLKVILKHPHLYDERAKEALSLFKDPFMREAAGLVSLYVKGGKNEALIDSIEDEGVRDFIAAALFKEDKGFMEFPERLFEDCIAKILCRGGVKEATARLLKGLEERGRMDLAKKMLERIMKDKRV